MDELLKQILWSTIKKLKSMWFPILWVIWDYYKVSENMNIYKKSYPELIEYSEQLVNKISNSENINITTIFEKNNSSENIINYIIWTYIVEIATFFAKNMHYALETADYINWFEEELLSFSHKKLLIVDFRNIHIRKPAEQEKMILYYLTLMNKRQSSKLYNIFIINDNILEIINSNTTIKSLIKNTKILTK